MSKKEYSTLRVEEETLEIFNRLKEENNFRSSNALLETLIDLQGKRVERKIVKEAVERYLSRLKGVPSNELHNLRAALLKTYDEQQIAAEIFRSVI